MRPDDLAAEVIKHLMAQVPSLDPALVDDLIVGNAIPEAEQGMQMARYISLLSLPKNVPGFIINRYCGSGLEAIALASAKVASGMADCVIAPVVHRWLNLPLVRPELPNLVRWYEDLRARPSSKVLELPLS